MIKKEKRKMKNKELKSRKGITLIALIITIIVMLILVAVTITMAINGGLFEYAGRAGRDTNNAIKAEQKLADGKIKIGHKKMGAMEFELPSTATFFKREENGIKYATLGCIWWFTNLETNKSVDPIKLVEKYDPQKHLPYDNYCAINVDKVKDIPYDSEIIIEIPDDDFEKWKAAYGDDCEEVKNEN